MTYYEILGVAPYASPEELRKAYHSLIKQYHPDNYKGDSNIAKEMIREFNVAYDTLSDPEKKLVYDYDLRHNSRDKTKSSNSGMTYSSKTDNTPQTETTSSVKSPKSTSAKVKTRDKKKRKFKIRVPNIKGCLWSVIGYACVALIIYKAFGGQIDVQGLFQWAEESVTKQVHQVSKVFDRDKNVDNIDNFGEETPSYVTAEFFQEIKERYENNDIKVTDYVSLDFGKKFEDSFNIDDETLENNCIFNDEFLKYYRDDYWKKCSEFDAWIKNEEIEGDKAKLKIEIDSANYSRAVEKAYTDLAIENAKKMKKNLYGLPDSELPSVFVDKLKKAVKRYDKTYIVNITFTLEKANGNWIITDCNDTEGLVNALLANGLSSVDTGEFDYLLLKYIE